MERSHKHAYVYEFYMKRRLPERGFERIFYTLLTNIDGPNCKENRALLETGLRIGYGIVPRIIRYQFDSYNK